MSISVNGLNLNPDTFKCEATLTLTIDLEWLVDEGAKEHYEDIGRQIIAAVNAARQR